MKAEFEEMLAKAPKGARLARSRRYYGLRYFIFIMERAYGTALKVGDTITLALPCKERRK